MPVRPFFTRDAAAQACWFVLRDHGLLCEPVQRGHFWFVEAWS